MSKTIYLLRHAQAVSSQGSRDQDRKLSEQGRQDARALGLVMRQKDYIPDIVLCSSAVRTRETLEGLNNEIQPGATDYSDALYAAAPGTMFSALQDLDEKTNSALIIAHNPGIHELAIRLCAEDGSSNFNKLMGLYRPATLCVIEAEIKKWNDLQLSTNTLADLLDPMDYNAPARPTRWM